MTFKGELKQRLKTVEETLSKGKNTLKVDLKKEDMKSFKSKPVDCMKFKNE